jgi:hypothetical protein
MDEQETLPPVQLDFWIDRWPLGLLYVTVLASVGTLVLSQVLWGGAATWPGMITGFAATALAFLVALAWDRRQRAVADLAEAAAEARRDRAAREAEQERRVTEARRRFAAIALELERLQTSLQRTVDEQQDYKYFFPDLPSGSWSSSSGPLGVIISNYSLMADLATLYGHVEELQWRLRFKAGARVDDTAIAPIITALATQMLSDVSLLLSQVRRQAATPDVERIEGIDEGGLVVARRQFTGAIRIVDFGGQAPGAARDG